MTAHRLVLDAAACDGHGICALCCPDRIGLDRWGYPELAADPIAGDRPLARARRAVAACPTGALGLEALPEVAPGRPHGGGAARPRWRRGGGWWR